MVDEITHCPIDTDGQPVKAYIFQNNLSDNAYTSDFYVGNPPQKIRDLFDTGSRKPQNPTDRITARTE